MKLETIYEYLFLLEREGKTVKELQRIRKVSDWSIRTKLKQLTDMSLVTKSQLQRHNSYHKLVDVYTLTSIGYCVYKKLYNILDIIEDTKVYI